MDPVRTIIMDKINELQVCVQACQRSLRVLRGVLRLLDLCPYFELGVGFEYHEYCITECKSKKTCGEVFAVISELESGGEQTEILPERGRRRDGAERKRKLSQYVNANLVRYFTNVMTSPFIIRTYVCTDNLHI